MAKIFNRARMTTSTTGTGTITLGSAVSGFATFAEAGVSDGDEVAYVIEEGNDFEIGIGTYTASGTTLSRDTVRLSKISGSAGTSKMNLGGNAEVFISPLAEELVGYDNASSGLVDTADLADEAVTYAKMQHVSATSRVLGRNSAGAGDVEEVTLSELLDFIGTAAEGDILYRGGSSWERLEAGSNDQVLTLASGVPSWADAGSPVKAWVNFDGTGTVSIRDSLNVSSITDEGTGRYTVNLSITVSHANYAVVGSNSRHVSTAENFTTTSFRIRVFEQGNGGNKSDNEMICATLIL